MTKAVSMTSLIRDTATELQLPAREVKDIVETFFETVMLELEDGNEVRVGNYLKFGFTYVRPLKKGTLVRSPVDGEMHPSNGRPESLVVKVRILKTMKEAAPAPNTKAGKPIADAAKAKIREREARAKERAKEAA